MIPFAPSMHFVNYKFRCCPFSMALYLKINLNYFDLERKKVIIFYYFDWQFLNDQLQLLALTKFFFVISNEKSFFILNFFSQNYFYYLTAMNFVEYFEFILIC